MLSQNAFPPFANDELYTSIDPLLDKIPSFGVVSLTASDAGNLDRERERRLKNPVIVFCPRNQEAPRTSPLLDRPVRKVRAFAYLVGLPSQGQARLTFRTRHEQKLVRLLHPAVRSP